MIKGWKDWSFVQGKLHFYGQDFSNVPAALRGPTWIYDLGGIGSMASHMSAVVPNGTAIHYAMKANSNKQVLKALRQSKVQIDVVSLGEMKLAKASGYRPGDIIFSGVGKTIEEIDAAIEWQIKLINVESIPELQRVVERARFLKKKLKVAIRFNPDVDAKTHPYIATGLKKNKFGIDRHGLQDFIQIAKASNRWIDFAGVSLHIGSQLVDLSPMAEAAQKGKRLAGQLKKLGFDIQYLNIGGGLAIQYLPNQKVPSLEDYGSLLSQIGWEGQLLIEPGRALVGSYGSMLTQVQYVKTHGSKTFVIVDVGMNDILRPALYQAYHHVLPLIWRGGASRNKVDIVGPICESSDVLGEGRQIGDVRSGDWLMIMDTGAYCESMRSNYNSRPVPAHLYIS